MKKWAAVLIIIVLVLSFSGCDYYSDESIHVVLDEADQSGLVEYSAGVSIKKNTARIDMLRYELDSINDGKIEIVLPESVKNEAGTEYAIDSFGGAIGPNAPLMYFSLVIYVQEKPLDETPVALTVDVGSLPLDTYYWNDIQVCFREDGSVLEIPAESVVFLSDAPLIYGIYLKEEAPNGALSDATDSDKWYEQPMSECLAGERMVIRVKNPDAGIERSLIAPGATIEQTAVCEEYTQYEFIMPYHSVRLTITDTEE